MLEAWLFGWLARCVFGGWLYGWLDVVFTGLFDGLLYSLLLACLPFGLLVKLVGQIDG